VKQCPVVLVKLAIFMTNTLHHLLNFVHDVSNVIYVWLWRETSYKVYEYWKLAFHADTVHVRPCQV